MAVVGLLVALLIPAVLAAREAAQRSQCASNLHQLGIALISYESAHGTLPLGLGGSGVSFQVAILPQIEQAALYHAINFEANGTAIALVNITVATAGPSTFLCPSDPVSGSLRIGRINYAGNRGVGVQKYGYNGAFAVDSPIRLQDFADGTSTTAAITEWMSGSGYPVLRDARRAVFQTNARLIRPDEFEQFADECRTIEPRTAKIGAPPYKGTNWLFGEYGFTLYNHTLAPNQVSCTNGGSFQQGAWTATSGHNKRVNLLFADGHVKVVSDSIRIEIWRALGSRAGREVVSSDSL